MFCTDLKEIVDTVWKEDFFFFEFFGVFSENISSMKLFYVTALFVHFVFVHIFATAEQRHNIESQVKPKHFVEVN